MQTHRPLSNRLPLRALIVTLIALLLPKAALATTNAAFVDKAFQDLLLRPASPSDLSTFVPLLDSTALTRTQFALNVMNTDEYRHVRINGFYSDFLLRSPSPGELSTFTTFLQTATLPQGRASILGSAEYFSTKAGGTNFGFLQVLYLDLLHRPIDPAALSFFTGQLTAGTVTRSDVAMTIQGSDEWRTDIVNFYYGQFLHRSPDAAGLSAFRSLLSTGGTEQQVIASLLGSEEYFNNVPEPAALSLLAVLPFTMMRRRP